MTHERDIERLLDHWFSDGPTEAPDRVIDVVVDRIGRQVQRPGWRLDWRTIHMNRSVEAAAGVAAVIVIAIVGFSLLRGGNTGIGGPGPNAATSPTMAPSSAPLPSNTAEASVAVAAPRACDLLTAAEVGTALHLSSEVTAGPASGSNRDVDYCVYQAGGAEVLGFSYRNVGGAAVFDIWSKGTGVQVVSGLGDRAVWDPAQMTLHILKGSRLVSIEGGGGSTPLTLGQAQAVGTILAGRM